MFKEKLFISSILALAMTGAMLFLAADTEAATTVGNNTSVGGTLGVTGATTLSSTLTVTGNILQGANSAIYQNDLPVFVASSTNYSLSVGTEAGKNLNNAGTNNIFLGYQAGYTATSTKDDIGIGYQALYNAKRTGTWDFSGYNVAIGTSALFNNTLGFDNVAIGYTPMYENTTGYYNVAIGRQALEKNTTGDSNISIGYYAGWANTTGVRNISIGYQAGYYGEKVSGNVAVGSDSLIYNVNGSWNTAVGEMALGYLWTQSFANTALGYQAGRGHSSAVYSNASSTWVGYQAGVNIRTGSKNMALGYKAGDALTTGSGNIIIGYDIDAPASTSDNVLSIGNMIFANGLGNTGTTVATGTVGIGIAAPTARLQVSRSAEGLEKLFQVGTSTSLDLFSVNSKGTVGVATSTPWQDMEFAVAGDILLTGSLYKSGTEYTNPDYVFAKYFGNPNNDYIPADYRMLSLDELRLYVEENHHLPGVEMQDDKIDIIEANRLNLEKIEEMSLYILELEERIENLENRLNTGQ